MVGGAATHRQCERMGSDAALDRAKGALIGLALGDALGTSVEFSERDSVPHVTDLAGGGPFGLAPGQWTDDTSMALCLAESLLERRALDPRDLMERFCRWRDHGYNSVTGTCFDIGVTTDAALRSFRATGEPLSGSTDPNDAGNGSLMRLSPVAIRWWRDRAEAVEAARLQSRTTHGAVQAVEACALFAEILVESIAGHPKESVLRCREWDGDARIAEVAAGSWRTKERDAISSSGYVLHTLEAALWCVGRTESVADALILAVNLGHDADTVGAVTGQLAGALWGMSGAPTAWLDRLAWRDRIESLAADLFHSTEVRNQGRWTAPPGGSSETPRASSSTRLRPIAGPAGGMHEGLDDVPAARPQALDRSRSLCGGLSLGGPGAAGAAGPAAESRRPGPGARPFTPLPGG